MPSKSSFPHSERSVGGKPQTIGGGKDRYMARKDNKGRNLKTGESYRATENRYMYRYKDERTGERVTVYALDLAELREKEKEIQRRLDSGLLTTSEAKKTDLNTMYEHYRGTLQIRDATLANYDALWEHHVRNDIGRMRMVDIKPSHIRTFYSDMTNKGYAWGTLKIIHGIFCPLFNLAMDDEIILRNPAMGNLEGYGVKPKEKVALTREEQKRLFEFVESSNSYNIHKPLLEIMIGTACRVGEISGLTWEDVDLQRRELTIDHQLIYKDLGEGWQFYRHEPKTEAGKRTIPISDTLYHAFVEQKKIQFMLGIHHDTEAAGLKNFVFTAKSGMPYAPNALNNVLKNIVNAYNKNELKLAEKERRTPNELPHLSCHSLRHTGCTRLAESGMDLKVLQYIMGHADASVTMDIYNHTSKERVFAEVEKMDAAMAV